MHRTVSKLIAGTLLLCSAVAGGEESADYPVPLQEGKPYLHVLHDEGFGVVPRQEAGAVDKVLEEWGLAMVVPGE